MITGSHSGKPERPLEPRARCARRLQIAAYLIAGLPMLVHGADPQRSDARESVISDSQIEQALQTPPKTRGFVVSARTETKQMIDLNIPFEFNSSELQPQAAAQLRQLQSALTSESLIKYRFMVAGHTDGKGSPQYNQQLSERRAEAVKRYLVNNGVAASRLEAVGFGANHLALPDRPEDAANRRVEIRNLGEGP
jgi:outer membrane protein OmpA-like peptidoglycan-associated protein